MEYNYYMIWLSNIYNIKRSLIFSLIKYFKTPENIWNADINDLMEFKGLRKDTALKIIKSRDKSNIDNIIYNLDKNNVKFISYYDIKYPKNLKNIDDPPLGLYLKGNIPNTSFERISIVGTRNCTEYGKSVAFNIAKELADKNFVIVSGMARGIDTFAHKGALNSIKGGTIAVLGSGLDICYPPENNDIMQKIIEKGCIFSEYPLGTKPYSYNFPSRNRIISGLSKAVIVVEAAENSGTFSTVEYALDNGRDVFAIPGNITSRYSSGTNKLIKQGCPAITNINDILFELGSYYEEEEEERYISDIPEELSDEEKEVYKNLLFEPVSIDELVYKMQKDLTQLQYILFNLEISGYIKKLPSMKYVRKLI